MKSETAKYLKWLLLPPLFLLGGVMALAFLYFVYCEVNKAYWDHKVKEWCEKDGGITVFEHIELTQDEFNKIGGNQYGEIPISDLKHTRYDHKYYISYDGSTIEEGNPVVGRSETKIIRKSDSKIMSVLVDYGRGGGDFLAIDHPSYFSCEEAGFADYRIIKTTVSIKGE